MTSSWTDESNLGASLYSSERYPEALVHYTNALNALSSDETVVAVTEQEKKKQRQILLSNVIACRLKIGGEDMIERALVEARECIAINPNWAKAHIRLASAYIAQGGHSNDACQALQRAISLDRDNKVAREMLVKELRRRDNYSCESEGGGGGDAADSFTGNSTQQTTSSHHTDNSNSNIDIDDAIHHNHLHGEAHSLSEMIQQYLTRAVSWYHSQSDDKKTLLKVSFCFLLLYIALGGRFGLEYAVGQNKKRGNYGAGNVYERYYSNRQQQQQQQQPQPSSFYNNDDDVRRHSQGQRRERAAYSSEQDNQRTQSSSNSYSGSSARQSGSETANTRLDDEGNHMYNDRTNPRNEQYYSQYNDRRRQQSSSYNSRERDRGSSGAYYNDRNNRRNNDRYYERYNEYEEDYYYERPGSSRSRSSISFGMPNLFDGSFQSMGILFIIGVICHRIGINPGQVFFMLNMANRRGGGGMYGRRGFGRAGGFGAGPGVGFRFGGGRNRFGRRY